jgi:plastocyanin
MRRILIPAVLIITGGIAALAFAAPAIEAGGGGHGVCAQPRDGADEPVVVKNMCFTPAVLYVQPGDTVEWQQKDAAPHNVTLFDAEVVGGNDNLYDGDTVTRAFQDPGVYAYYCSIHPSMLGVIVVGDPAEPEFGAGLSHQSSQEQTQAVVQHHPAASVPPAKGLNDKLAGQQPGGFKWAEAALGLGLFGGLLVGLVAVGGGFRLQRRGR